MNEKDVEIIDKSLSALRDHFEKEGKVFICAYQVGEKGEFFGNVISTTATDNEYGHAIMRWANRMCDWIDEEDNHNKPWKS